MGRCWLVDVDIVVAETQTDVFASEWTEERETERSGRRLRTVSWPARAACLGRGPPRNDGGFVLRTVPSPLSPLGRLQIAPWLWTTPPTRTTRNRRPTWGFLAGFDPFIGRTAKIGKDWGFAASSRGIFVNLLTVFSLPSP